MSTKEDELECTCGFFAHPWIHHIDCDLWHDVDFTMGFKEWDPDNWELSEASYDGLGRTEADWNAILDTEGTAVDAWQDEDPDAIEIMSDAEADALVAWLQEHQPDEPAVVKTEVTPEEYASADGPPPGVLKCFCFNEKKGTWCGPCGLTRKTSNDPWEPGFEHKKWLNDPNHRTECMCLPQCSIQCEKSKVQRWSSKANHWVFWDAAAAEREERYQVQTTTWNKCRHYGKAVTFPDGTIVYASSVHTKKDDDLFPDLGIYMAGSWTPRSVAFHLGWQDFGLPTIPDDDVRFIVDQGIEWARGGSIVEVGCVGGHGRTGSVLALMALSCGVNDPDKAIAWVRENYCTEAIEGDKQKWYIRKYHAILNGLPIPPEPVIVKTTVAKTTVIGSPQASHTSGSGVKTTNPAKEMVVVPPSALGDMPYGWEDLMGWL